MDKKNIKNKLISDCRFYKGEKENPYSYEERGTLWALEYMWVDFNLRNPSFLAECVGEYISRGLGGFSPNDGVPLSLKAFIFNRHEKNNERVDPDSFKLFYLRNYLNEQ